MANVGESIEERRVVITIRDGPVPEFAVQAYNMTPAQVILAVGRALEVVTRGPDVSYSSEIELELGLSRNDNVAQDRFICSYPSHGG